MSNKTHIALLMMVKNESKRIEISLKSVLGYVDSFVIYDTGSEDDTIEIITNFADKHKIPLHLKQGPFVDFAISRNVAIDFAEEFEEIDWLLLLDCNDELQNGHLLRNCADKLFEEPVTSFLLCQVWQSGTLDKYWNTRFFKTKKGWRYKGSVHEYLVNDDKNLIVGKLEGPVLFQDRTKDDDKSSKRFTRDKILLEKEFEKSPEDTRTIFYLAQTYSCLNMYKEAKEFYLLRSKYENYPEERFQSFLRAATIADEKLNEPWDDCLPLYLKASEVCERAEPLVKIAQYYNKKKKWRLAYTFAKAACEIDYPHDTILFVNKSIYDYERWHILGIVSFYCGRFIEGKIGCLKAIEQNVNPELDQNNLKFYENVDYTNIPLCELDREILKYDCSSSNSSSNNIIKMSKKEFMTVKTAELKKKNPNLSNKNIQSKVLKLWKNYR